MIKLLRIAEVGLYSLPGTLKRYSPGVEVVVIAAIALNVLQVSP